MAKTYFLAPNFSTAPPPKGPIHLGSILRNLTEFKCINRTPMTIPKAQLYPVDIKTEYEVSLRDLHSADFGIAAKVLGLVGLGARASVERTKGSNNVLSCQYLETTTFDVTDSYINDSMKDSRVKAFLRSNKKSVPIYMVTGLKIARGGSLTSSTSRTVALEADAGVVPHGTPLEVGVRAGYASSAEEGEKWGALTDFIAAFQVVKIWQDRKGEVKYQAHNEMAVMQSGTSSTHEPEYTILWDDELTLEEINKMFGMAEDGI
ncbi:hypothetical protein CEP52_008326 [Fusarium oligoseptatum]|uniref:Uncharacterized protein n=1 Tax=Fusarium oligoseptatum TaxID=2604345 RepID=A0A428TID1_9HYPO|nr:hypothetical protein CEP52_008326 [Fusarium oligoseptatum]